jgi:hypothetical protein
MSNQTRLNAPSESSEREAYKAGYRQGYLDGLKAYLNNDTKPPELSRSFEEMGEKE